MRVEKDVLRLDIPVDDVLSVQVLQTRHHLYTHTSLKFQNSKFKPHDRIRHDMCGYVAIAVCRGGEMCHKHTCLNVNLICASDMGLHFKAFAPP